MVASCNLSVQCSGISLMLYQLKIRETIKRKVSLCSTEYFTQAIYICRMSDSKMSLFTNTSERPYHIELDLRKPGNIIYIEGNALVTSAGGTSKPELIAGQPSESGFNEGEVGSEARFHGLTGFVQIDKDRVIVVDSGNNCLRSVSRPTGKVEEFSGECRKSGLINGKVGRFDKPLAVIFDKVTKNQLLVVDSNNKAIRTVSTVDGSVGFIVRHDHWSFEPATLTQQENGDIYVNGGMNFHHIAHDTKKITKLPRYVNCRYHQELSFIKQSVMIAPFCMLRKITLVDVKSDKYEVIKTPEAPYGGSFIVRPDCLYVAEKGKILKYTCMYNHSSITMNIFHIENTHICRLSLKILRITIIFHDNPSNLDSLCAL